MIKLKDILKESLNEISKEQDIQKLIDFVKKYQNQIDENTQQQNNNAATFQLNQLSWNGQPLQGELVFNGGIVSNNDGNFTKYSDPNIPFDPRFNVSIAQSGLENNFKKLMFNIHDTLEDNINIPQNILNYLNQISPNFQEVDRWQDVNINTNNIIYDVDNNLINIINSYDPLLPHAPQVANVISKSLTKVATNKSKMDFTVDETCQLTVTNPNVFPNNQGGIYLWKQTENNTPLYIGKAGGNNPASSLRSYKSQYSQDRSGDREHTLSRTVGAQNTQPTRVKVNGKICKRIHDNPNDQLWFGVVSNNILTNIAEQNQDLYNAYLNLPTPPQRNIQTFFEDLLLTYYDNLEINDDGPARDFNTLNVTRTNQQNETKRLQKLAGIIKEEEDDDFNITVGKNWNDNTEEIIENGMKEVEKVLDKLNITHNKITSDNILKSKDLAVSGIEGMFMHRPVDDHFDYYRDEIVEGVVDLVFGNQWHDEYYKYGEVWDELSEVMYDWVIPFINEYIKVTNNEDKIWPFYEDLYWK
jgi:hypothetical protein